METRTGFLLGGAAVFAVSVSVVASVVATSAVALADAPGVLVGAAPVSLAAVESSRPTSGAAGQNVAVVEATSVDAPPLAEVLPAPAPVVVAPPQPVVAVPPVTVEDEVLASGSWDSVHEWADAHGWTRAEVDAWITKFRATHQLTRDDADVSPESVGRDAPTPQTPASTGLSDTVATTPGDGSKKNRSQGTPDPGD